ncbi:hypothetical protein F3D3_3603 [Fusibacter sp. 3D3]|nr:hypothetical protein F3D3_3603 [Fusibacter sp. 3D3]
MVKPKSLLESAIVELLNLRGFFIMLKLLYDTAVKKKISFALIVNSCHQKVDNNDS